MKSRAPMFLLALLCLALVACAAGPNDQIGSANAQGIVAGFWRGLWHGMIAPITFVISLFSDGIRMYESHNNGGWYDFGFLIGITMFHGGGATAGRRARRRRPAAALANGE